MQWQHGSYTVFGNGTLILTPIAVDGRQLLSDPCRQQSGQYTRYNTTEEFKVHLFHFFLRLILTTHRNFPCILTSLIALNASI